MYSKGAIRRRAGIIFDDDIVDTSMVRDWRESTKRQYEEKMRLKAKRMAAKRRLKR